MDREKSLFKAIAAARNSAFKARAVKVELEANLNRRMNSTEAHDFIMEELAKIGLAEQKDDFRYIEHSGIETDWWPIWPLTYLEVYNDGSVDTECTFTIVLDKPQNAYLLPKVIDAFNLLAKAEGGVDVRGAGMHLSFLQSDEGYYTESSSEQYGDDRHRYMNFKRSMTLLLPALYFLGSADGTSRGMGYRYPQIGSTFDEQGKYSAIFYVGNCLEYRVFDTCYDNPEAILDHLIVMANCLKYWTDEYTPSGIEKVTTTVKWGTDRVADRKLERFYTTVAHVDVLNAGLTRLKPSYQTLTQVKKQRGFTVSRRVLVERRKEEEKAAIAAYKEYEERFEWRLKALGSQVLTDLLGGRAAGANKMSEAEIHELADKQAQELIEREKQRKRSLKDYVSEQVKNYENSLQGRWTLAV